MNVEMVPVESSTIKQVGYNQQESKMIVMFNSGTRYEYLDITEEEYKSILTDQSIGSKLRKVIGSKEYNKI